MNQAYIKVKWSCFFCETEREMTASWPVCTYNKENDPYYWQKSPYCETNDNCPYYCSKEHAFNIVHNTMNKEKGEVK